MRVLVVTYDSFVGFGFNRYAYCMYNQLKMASHHMTVAMANCLYGHGPETHRNGSGNHGSPGGSVEVQSLGKGVFVENAIIDMNDYSGQDFWDEFLSDTPSLFTYIFDKENGGRHGGYYDFKVQNMGYNWGFHIFHTYWMNLLFH